MATTVHQSARERILDAAHGLVLESGFSATTLESILEAADASKGAFFHHFESKAALGEAMLRRYADRDAELFDEFMARAEAETDDPGEQVVLFVKYFEEAADDIAFQQPGCLFVSFIYERGPNLVDQDDVIAGTVQYWRTNLLRKLELAATTRSSLDDVDLSSLSDQVFSTFEGGFVLARAMNDPTHLGKQLSHLRRYLELLLLR